MTTRYVDDAYTFYAVTTRFDTGNATDGDSAPTYRIYEEETGTPLLTGSMALLDSGNTAGLYSEQVTLSAANGFEVGKCYCVYIAGTVNSVAGADIREFVVRKKPLTPTTEGRELDVSAGGEAGIDWANIGSPTTAVNLSGTNIDTDQVVASVSGAVGSVTGAVGSVTGAVGSVTGNVGGNVAGSVGSVTGNVGGNVTGSVGSLAAQAKADVNAEVDSALDTAIPGTPTSNSINERIQTLDDNFTSTVAGRIDAAISSRSTVTTAQVNSECDTALADVGLTTTITGRIDAAVSTRLATASYTAPLDAAGTRTAVGLASANLDTQLDALPTAAENTAAVLAGAVEGAVTVKQSLQLSNAAAASKLAGAATSTVTVRDLADTKNRITATVDADGNRTAVTTSLD
jgi:hypothetical protein